MKKNILYILPAMAILASCGGSATVDQAQLDAKVNAIVKKTQDNLKTDCDARVIMTAQRRADSVKAVSNIPVVVPPVAAAPVTSPAVKTPAPVKTPVKAPVKATTKPTPSKTVSGGGLRSQSDKAKATDKKAVEGGGLRSQSDKAKATDKKTVEGGGLRSRSDKNLEQK